MQKWRDIIYRMKNYLLQQNDYWEIITVIILRVIIIVIITHSRLHENKLFYKYVPTHIYNIFIKKHISLDVKWPCLIIISPWGQIWMNTNFSSEVFISLPMHPLNRSYRINVFCLLGIWWKNLHEVIRTRSNILLRTETLGGTWSRRRKNDCLVILPGIY